MNFLWPKSLLGLVVVLGSAGIAPLPARALTLVENGRAKAPIVVFKDAPYLTRLAADDLADYIAKVSGARPQVIQGWPDALPEHAIWVGCQPGLEKLFPGVDLQFHHPEEILIAANDAHVLIAGRDRWVPDHLDVPGRMMEQGGSRESIVRGVQQEYGTANAVSAFMETQLGIRWLWPGEVDVPARSTLTVEPFVYRYHPQMRSRAQMFWHLSRVRTAGPGHPESDWARFNRIQLDSLEARAGEHGFSDWWERFGRTHPEYFALQPDGTRNGFPEPRYAKICESNPAVWEQWLQDVDRALAANPGRVGFSAAANDSWRSGHCTCANCRAWDDPGAPSRKFHWGTGSRDGVALADRQVRFANVLARKLKERYPDRTLYVSVLAYGLSRPAPTSAVPDDNVIIGSVANFCFDLNATDGGGADNVRHLDQFKAWGKVAPHLYWRPNVNRDVQQGVPLDTRVIRDHFRVLADAHALGVYIDTMCRYWALNGPAYYLMAQLAWNPQQDGQAVLDDYFEHGFGPAAGALKAYQLLLDEARSAHYANGNGSDGQSWFKAYTPAFFAGAKSLLSQAAARVADDQRYLRRVAFMTVGLEFLELQTQGRVLADKIKAGGASKADALAQLTKNWQRILKLAETNAYAIHPQFLQAIRKQPVPINPKAYNQGPERSNVGSRPELSSAGKRDEGLKSDSPINNGSPSFGHGLGVRLVSAAPVIARD